MYFRDGEDITKIFGDYQDLILKNDKIVQAFDNIGYHDVAKNINICSKEALMKVCNNCASLHFVSTITCKSRFCYSCSKKRYLSYIAKYKPILDKFVQDGKKLIFVTWTLKNMDNLKEMIDRFNKTFKKFREKYEAYYKYVEGGIITTEVTNIGNGWHVHKHSILIVNADFPFTARQYQSILKKAWEEKTKDSHQINVKEIKDNENLIKAVCETFKYITKLKMINECYLKELYDFLYRRRFISTVGCMYGLVLEEDIEKDLENVDTRDLENLVCAVCGYDAMNMDNVKFKSKDIVDFNLKVYSLKKMAIIYNVEK